MSSTATDWTTIPAGREMDALVALILGDWRKHPEWYWFRDGVAPEVPDLPTPNGFQPMFAGPCFSTEIGATWLVVTHLRSRGWGFQLWARDGDLRETYGSEWAAEFDRQTYPGIGMDIRRKGNGASPALAICRAALATVNEGPTDV